MGRPLRAKLERKIEPIGATNRWRFECRDGRFVIELLEVAKGWVPAAIMTETASVQPEALARYVVRVLNEKQQEAIVLDEAVYALSELIKEGVTYGTEYDAERSVRLLEKQTDKFRQLIDTLELVLKEGVTVATTEQAERTLAHMRERSMAANQF